ncbi:MAG: diacylglycerol O-acyltransferase / wax synthase [Acidimicrobiaceae bacterium]
MADEMRFENRMSDADALMWTIEKDPLLRSTITSVAVLDQSPDRDRLVESLDRATRLVPRLRQRVVANPMSIAPPRWEFDPNFDIAYHLRWMKAPGDGGLRALLDVAQPIAMQGFDRARPLWEFVVVDGLAEGRAGLIIKVHHAITDGVGAVKIAMHLFDLERDVSLDRGPMPEEPTIHVMNQLERVRDALDHERRRQTGIARRSAASITTAAAGAAADAPGALRQLGATVASIGRMLAPATTPLSPIMTGRSLSVHFETITVPLAELKSAAKKAEGKLNDAFVAGITGGLRRYHQKHGADVEALRMSMPINIRNDDTADLAGNQFAPARFTIPIAIDDPIDRMRATRKLVALQRGEPALSLAAPLAGILYRLPASVTTGVFGSLLRGIDFVTSNVPGVPIPVFFGGARMEAQFAFGPMSGSATNITLLSYLDEVQIAVNTDPAAIPDPQVFLACLLEGIDEIRKVG